MGEETTRSNDGRCLWWIADRSGGLLDGQDDPFRRKGLKGYQSSKDDGKGDQNQVEDCLRNLRDGARVLAILVWDSPQCHRMIGTQVESNLDREEVVMELEWDMKNQQMGAKVEMQVAI